MYNLEDMIEKTIGKFPDLVLDISEGHVGFYHDKNITSRENDSIHSCKKEDFWNIYKNVGIDIPATVEFSKSIGYKNGKYCLITREEFFDILEKEFYPK